MRKATKRLMKNSEAQTKNIICVTNRHLCEGGLIGRLAKIASAARVSRKSGGPHLAGIILREKDLPPDEYLALAREAAAVCSVYEVRLIPHFYAEASGFAVPDGSALHMPLQKLQELAAERGPLQFSCLGASCHSPEDARLAERLGCTYVTFGHVFETDCKKGLAPRGLDRLEETAQSVDIPVYAIGGIAPDNYMSALERGAAGACVMSGLMRCADPLEYLMSFGC